MRKYASTFTVGLKDVVKDIFQTLCPDVKILLLLDGLIVYQGNLSIKKVKQLRFITNSFIVLDIFQNLHGNPIQEMLTATARDKSLESTIYDKIKTAPTGKTFRVVTSRENQFVSVNRSWLERIESRISGIKGLRLNRAKPATEFWFLYRSEGYGFFMMRLTTHTAYEQTLQKGELKPELAYLLCFLSEANAADIFLDPFCGYGAIPMERALAFPYNMIFAIDKDPAKKKFVRNRLKAARIKKTFIVKNQDALNLAFDVNFIHKIVTDPPWGLFEKLDLAVADFYTLMLKELGRVLRPKGIMVILSARKAEFEQALSSFEGRQLTLLNKYDILVSGKKAAVYKMRKLADWENQQQMKIFTLRR